MKLSLMVAAALLSAVSHATAVTVLNQFGEAIDALTETTVVTTEASFDVMGGSTIVLTLTAESAGFPGGSTPPGASAERVLFGRQPMTFAGATVNAGSNPTTQVTEVWYLHNPWNQAASFRVEWDGGNGTGVSGTGFGAVSLSNADQSVPDFFGNDLGLSVDLTGLSNDFVIAAAVANDSSDDVMAGAGLTELYGSAGFGEPRTGGVGSARAASAFTNNVTGDFTAEFMLGFFGGTPSRPAASAAAFATGPFVAATPAPVPGDTNGDGVLNAADYNAIRTAIGQNGQPLGTLGPDVIGFDGKVNLDDLVFFLSEYPGDVSALSIPEPAAAGLALVAASVVAGLHSRARG